MYLLRGLSHMALTQRPCSSQSASLEHLLFLVYHLPSLSCSDQAQILNLLAKFRLVWCCWDEAGQGAVVCDAECLERRAVSICLVPSLLGAKLQHELAPYKTSENPHESPGGWDNPGQGPHSTRRRGANCETQVHRKITLLILGLVFCLPSLSV